MNLAEPISQSGFILIAVKYTDLYHQVLYSEVLWSPQLLRKRHNVCIDQMLDIRVIHLLPQFHALWCGHLIQGKNKLSTVDKCFSKRTLSLSGAFVATFLRSSVTKLIIAKIQNFARLY